MNKSELHDIINQVIQDSGSEKINDIYGKMKLRDDLKLDSLGLATLTVLIEDRCGVDIFEDGIVLTVDEIYLKLGIS